ncbi:MAG: putative sulfate exporter family transporter [Planctomycetota bacterium]|nr:MAG: putative sulfate exporter family transporter [Planctomycetota bacterium]
MSETNERAQQAQANEGDRSGAAAGEGGSELLKSEDWWALWCGGLLLALSTGLVVWRLPVDFAQRVAAATAGAKLTVENPLKPWLAKPGSWTGDPREAFRRTRPDGEKTVDNIRGTLGAFLLVGVLFAVAQEIRERGAAAFLRAYPVVFLLAVLAYVLAGHAVVKMYNLEYPLWALLVGLVISNTIGTPRWMLGAVLTEFYIKTGLVLLGAEILFGRLLVLGLPGIFVAWVVTPIVLVGTYLFGQKVLKIPSRSLNMVISADMSVCGVSAAIATAAACKAKKEELSLAIGLSLSFTAVMMVVMPALIQWVGMDQVLGGAWIGGTIDATGAVAAAGEMLGERALKVAAAVKMIQNILIGVIAFAVAVYWVTRVERSPDAPSADALEIWRRFPKFVLGFVAASIVFSLLHGLMTGGPLVVDAIIRGSTKTLRGWLFCLAFVSIGLQTDFRKLWPYFRGGKPVLLYLCGQTFNLCLTLAMAWLMFRVVFRDQVDRLFGS